MASSLRKIDYDAENKLWQYGYDTVQQILTVTDPVNVVIVNNVFDDHNRVTQVTDALNHTAQIDYDAEHHPIAARNALAQQAVTTYTTAGLIASRTDAHQYRHRQDRRYIRK